MGTLSRGYSFSATEQVTAAKLHLLIDSGTVTAIETADISDAQITNAKINDVSGAKFTNLSSIPSGAGVIPAANVTSVAQKGANTDITSLAGLTTLLSRSQGGLASNVANNDASGVVFLDANSKLPAVDGSQLTNLLVTKNQLFTSSGTFTAPAGVTKVYVTMIGGGAGGGASWSDVNAGGGGSGGYYVIKRPHTVTPSSAYTVTVGGGGAGGIGQPNNGAGGGTSAFDSLSVSGGNGGTFSTGIGGSAAKTMDATTTTAGVDEINSGAGGNAVTTTGGGGGGTPWGNGGGGSTNAGANTGAGGGGANKASPWTGGNGGSGFVLVEW